MRKLVKNRIKAALIVCLFTVFTMGSSAQQSNDQAFEKAKKEIKETFGTVPLFLDAFPKYALPAEWQSYKAIKAPGNIDSKTRELIMLAVASQIPCTYCLYAHTTSAKAKGATDEEIKEAVALAAYTRHWSTVLYGAQTDLVEFKKQYDKMMKYMAKKAEAK